MSNEFDINDAFMFILWHEMQDWSITVNSALNPMKYHEKKPEYQHQQSTTFKWIKLERRHYFWMIFYIIRSEIDLWPVSLTFKQSFALSLFIFNLFFKRYKRAFLYGFIGGYQLWSLNECIWTVNTYNHV